MQITRSALTSPTICLSDQQDWRSMNPRVEWSTSYIRAVKYSTVECESPLSTIYLYYWLVILSLHLGRQHCTMANSNLTKRGKNCTDRLCSTNWQHLCFSVPACPPWWQMFCIPTVGVIEEPVPFCVQHLPDLHSPIALNISVTSIAHNFKSCTHHNYQLHNHQLIKYSLHYKHINVGRWTGGVGSD